MPDVTETTINAVDLTAETLNSLDGTENIVAFDTAEGKKIPLSVLGDYVVQKLTQTLLGQTQTVQDAFGMLQAKTYSLTGVGITVIPENGDLNDYTDIGMYGQATNATAQTIANKPSDLTTGFKMYVEELSPAASDTGKYRYRRQVLIAQTENSPMYIRRFTTSNTGSTWTWRNWEKMPMRSEMDTATNKVSAIVGMSDPGSMTSYSTQQFTVASSSRHLIIISGAKSVVHGLLLVSVNSSGGVFLTPIHVGDGLVITAPSNNVLQVENTSNVACYFTDICTNGTAITKVTEPSS